MSSRSARHATALAFVTAATVLPVVPASAQVVPTPTWINVDDVPGGFEVCAHGESDSTVANAWVFRIDGVRVYDPTVLSEREDTSAPLVAGTIIAYSATGSGRVFHTCAFVSTDNSSAGHAQMTLGYGGAATDFALVVVGAGAWALGESYAIGSGVG